MCFAIGDIEKYYIYFSRAWYRGCARCPLFPDLLCGLGFTSEHPAFVAGLQLVGCLQKGTDVGRVLRVGDASVGEAAVPRTSASVRSRRTRGRWRLRQSESSAHRGTPGGPQR